VTKWREEAQKKEREAKRLMANMKEAQRAEFWSISKRVKVTKHSYVFMH
jgi:hypothetical protein